MGWRLEFAPKRKKTVMIPNSHLKQLITTFLVLRCAEDQQRTSADMAMNLDCCRQRLKRRFLMSQFAFLHVGYRYVETLRIYENLARILGSLLSDYVWVLCSNFQNKKVHGRQYASRSQSL